MFEPILKIGGNFSGEPRAAPVEPEAESTVLAQAVKAKLFEEQAPLQRYLELFHLKHL